MHNLERDGVKVAVTGVLRRSSVRSQEERRSKVSRCLRSKSSRIRVANGQAKGHGNEDRVYGDSQARDVRCRFKVWAARRLAADIETGKGGHSEKSTSESKTIGKRGERGERPECIYIRKKTI